MKITASILHPGIAIACGMAVLFSPPLSSIRADEPQRPMPCSEDPQFRAFDFWLGTWDVYTRDDKLVGSNRITKRAGGCVILEEWRSGTGGSGVSVNYYDPSTGQWVQVWNGSGGTQITIRGGLDEEGSMRLTGTLYYVGRDHSVDFRGIWTPLPDGRVRQYFEQSADEGETWQAWFEGFYRRQHASPDAAREPRQS